MTFFSYIMLREFIYGIVNKKSDFIRFLHVPPPPPSSSSSSSQLRKPDNDWDRTQIEMKISNHPIFSWASRITVKHLNLEILRDPKHLTVFFWVDCKSLRVCIIDYSLCFEKEQHQCWRHASIAFASQNQIKLYRKSTNIELINKKIHNFHLLLWTQLQRLWLIYDSFCYVNHYLTFWSKTTILKHVFFIIILHRTQKKKYSLTNSIYRTSSSSTVLKPIFARRFLIAITNAHQTF